MKKKIIRIVALSLVAGATALWWFDVPSRVGWAKGTERALTLYGNVDIHQVRLGFRVGGRVAEMVVDEGNTVHPGQLMARLDAKPYETAVRAAEARVASLTAKLEKLEAGPRKPEIDRARAELAERNAELQNVEQDLGRAKRLRASGAISQASLDQSRTSKEMATARVSSAREALRLLEDGTRPEEIAAARANLDAAQANLSAVKTELQDAQLHAPAAGTVLSRVREPGAIVGPGETVYVLSLEKPVWVRAYIAETHLGRIHPGLEVKVVTDTKPDRPYRGRVGFISPVAEFTPKSVQTPELRTDLVYRLRVIVDQPDQGLRQGMPVTIHLLTTAPDQPGKS